MKNNDTEQKQDSPPRAEATRTKDSLLSHPKVSISLTSALKLFFTQWDNFSGSSSRRYFWWPVLIYVVLMLGFSSIQGTILSETPKGSIVGSILSIMPVVLSIIIFVPMAALTCRRLHDAGFSGGWSFTIFLPVIGLIVLLSMAAIPSRQTYMNPTPDAAEECTASGEHGTGRPIRTLFAGVQLILLIITVILFIAGMNNLYLSRYFDGGFHNIDGAWDFMSTSAAFGVFFMTLSLPSLLYTLFRGRVER